MKATQNVPGVVCPTRKSNRQARKVLVTDNVIETGRNEGVRKTSDKMCQWFPSSVCSLTESFS